MRLYFIRWNNINDKLMLIVPLYEAKSTFDVSLTGEKTITVPN
jgi:hypothetical protein